MRAPVAQASGWDRLASQNVQVSVAQTAIWDRLDARRVDINVLMQQAVWDRLDSRSVTITPAAAPPPPPPAAVWDRLASRSVSITPAAAPPPPPPPAGQFTIQVAVTPVNSGTVTKTPDKASYASGDTVTLTAKPGTGYVFDYWDAGGQFLDNKNPLALTVKANLVLTAHFKTPAAPPTTPPVTPPPAQYTIQVAVAPLNSGTAKKDPDKASYATGDVVKLTATAATGYVFDYWDTGGQYLDNKNPLTVTVKASLKLTAHFKKPGAPPTKPTAGAGAPTGLIIGGLALLGIIAVGAGAKRRKGK